jgi:hypothetical protein
MAYNVSIKVSKIESAGPHISVTTQIDAPFLNFELQFRVDNTGSPQQALEEARLRLLDLGNGIVAAADHPLVM